MAAQPHPAVPGALPRDLARGAVEVFGRARVVEWCEELLAGRARVDDPGWPDIAWLDGTAPAPRSAGRLWGARGLLHIGPPARPAIVLAALHDDAWQVREMCLKVVRRHALDDPDGIIDGLVADPVERVRIQAWMALGLPVPHEQQA
jgi:hypothetical protein